MSLPQGAFVHKKHIAISKPTNASLEGGSQYSSSCLAIGRTQYSFIRIEVGWVRQNLIINEPEHTKLYNFACPPGEDSDQPAHPLSDQNLRCSYEKSLDERPAKTLIRLRECAG